MFQMFPIKLVTLVAHRGSRDILMKLYSRIGTIFVCRIEIQSLLAIYDF